MKLSFVTPFFALALVACAGSSSSTEDVSAIEQHDTLAADGGAADGGVTPFTKAEAQTLVNARCAGCHSGGEEAAAGLDFGTDFTLATVNVGAGQVATMKLIAPGKKADSYLFHKVAGTHLEVGGRGKRMPSQTPLSAVEVARLGAFIDAL